MARFNTCSRHAAPGDAVLQLSLDQQGLQVSQKVPPTLQPQTLHLDCCRCTCMSAAGSHVVLRMDALVQQPAVQPAVRPVEPAVVQIVQSHDGCNDVCHLHTAQYDLMMSTMPIAGRKMCRSPQEPARSSKDASCLLVLSPPVRRLWATPHTACLSPWHASSRLWSAQLPWRQWGLQSASHASHQRSLWSTLGRLAWDVHSEFVSYSSLCREKHYTRDKMRQAHCSSSWQADSILTFT